MKKLTVNLHWNCKICFIKITTKKQFLPKQINNMHFTPQWQKMKVCDFPYDMIMQVGLNYGRTNYNVIIFQNML